MTRSRAFSKWSRVSALYRALEAILKFNYYSPARGEEYMCLKYKFLMHAHFDRPYQNRVRNMDASRFVLQMATLYVVTRTRHDATACRMPLFRATRSIFETKISAFYYLLRPHKYSTSCSAQFYCSNNYSRRAGFDFWTVRANCLMV